MNDSIQERISRIYAAIDTIEEADLNKLKATVIQTDKIRTVYQDFRGGFSEDELANQAHMVIHNIANLRDHLLRWAARNGHDGSKVDQAVKSSPAVQIIRDLSDNDKHGYPRRNGGYSRRSPRLVEINRVMRLQTQAKPGSGIALTIGAGGRLRVSGDGTAKAVVTGEVIDNNDNRIGDLYEIACEAVAAWENLLRDFGLMATTDGA